MGKKLDLTGQRFGKLVAIRDSGERTNSKEVLWECECDCGKSKNVRSTKLRKGRVKSCGCLELENRYKINKKFIDREVWKCENSIKFLKKDTAEKGTRISKIKKSDVGSNNASGYKGVNFYKPSKKWRAYINFKKQNIHLGYYADKQDAINARLEAEEKYFKPILEKYKKEGVEELEGLS